MFALRSCNNREILRHYDAFAFHNPRGVITVVKHVEYVAFYRIKEQHTA